MKYLLSVTLVFAFVLLSNCEPTSPLCPLVSTTLKLNTTRFSGLWYKSAVLVAAHQIPPPKCQTLSVWANNATFFGLNARTYNQKTGASRPTNLEFHLDRSVYPQTIRTNVVVPVNTYNTTNFRILRTDYTKYALAHACIFVRNGLLGGETWLFTRDQYPSKRTLNKARRAISLFGFDPTKFNYSVVSGCRYI